MPPFRHGAVCAYLQNVICSGFFAGFRPVPFKGRNIGGAGFSAGGLHKKAAFENAHRLIKIERVDFFDTLKSYRELRNFSTVLLNSTLFVLAME